MALQEVPLCNIDLWRRWKAVMRVFFTYFKATDQQALYHLSLLSQASFV